MKATQLKPADLRIGNWVMPLHEIKPRKELFADRVKSIKEDCLYCECSESPFEWYEPIPLTKEWLKKNGFKRKDYKYSIDHDGTDYILEFDDREAILGVRHFHETSYFAWNIKYVHQLQNIYHALTGQELTIGTSADNKKLSAD